MKTREIGTMTECRFPDKKEAVYATASIKPTVLEKERLYPNVALDLSVVNLNNQKLSLEQSLELSPERLQSV
ncbi:unnamed protein product, partial [marine sediment metagenome]